MAKILYIIGNGFDQHHGLRTCYEDFREYLKINNPDLYKEISTIYGVDVDVLWSDFEAKLSELYHRFDDKANYSYILTEFAPNYENDEHGSIDRETELSKMTYDFEKLKTTLQNAFESWIADAYCTWIKNKSNHTKLLLDKNALYLNFNYTRCLQDCYKIPEENILHIHNAIDDIGYDNLIYGHGGDKMPFHDIDNPLFEKTWGRQAENIVSDFHNRLRKDTQSIIYSNDMFFNSLMAVDTIYILGHSCNNIDMPYFERIKSAVSDSAKWYISYFLACKPKYKDLYYESECEKVASFASKIKISNYELIKLGDLS